MLYEKSFVHLYLFFKGEGNLQCHMTKGGSEPFPLNPAVVCLRGRQ